MMTPYHVKCPLCGAEPMHRCETPTGYGSPPHDRRWKAAGIGSPTPQDRMAAWNVYQEHIRDGILKGRIKDRDDPPQNTSGD